MDYAKEAFALIGIFILIILAFAKVIFCLYYILDSKFRESVNEKLKADLGCCPESHQEPEDQQVALVENPVSV